MRRPRWTPWKSRTSFNETGIYISKMRRRKTGTTVVTNARTGTATTRTIRTKGAATGIVTTRAARVATTTGEKVMMAVAIAPSMDTKNIAIAGRGVS